MNIFSKSELFIVAQYHHMAEWLIYPRKYYTERKRSFTFILYWDICKNTCHVSTLRIGKYLYLCSNSFRSHQEIRDCNKKQINCLLRINQYIVKSTTRSCNRLYANYLLGIQRTSLSLKILTTNFAFTAEERVEVYIRSNALMFWILLNWNYIYIYYKVFK